MSETRDAESDEIEAIEPALAEAVLEYLKLLEAGTPPNHSEFVAAHPDVADQLKSFLANRKQLESRAEKLRRNVGHWSDQSTIDGPAGKDGEGVLTKVRYFGDYELLAEIGQGGMGVVHKARQLNLNRLVALKMILGGRLANPQAVERFRGETLAAARLDHPHIVPVFEVGEHEGHQYFSMAFVEGGSLAAKLVAGPLEPKEAAKLLKTLAEAVEYAHRRGVIHRDLKPSNILLDLDGQPKIGDFGLAKRTDDDGIGRTATGEVLGTPGFMPPEQAGGHGKSAGPAADVYGLGAILYACLTGRPPFQAATAVDTLVQVLNSDPVAVRRLVPATPVDLETIALKCLEKDPNRRYTTAAELAAELGRFLAGEPIRARPAGVRERAVKWARRRPAAAALIATAILVPASAMIALIAINITIERERNFAELARISADTARDAEREQRNRAEQLLAEERRTSYFERIARAQTEWQAGRVERAKEILFECPLSLRHWEWNHLDQLCHSEKYHLENVENPVHAVVVTHDGQTAYCGGGSLSSAGSRSELHEFDLKTGKEQGPFHAKEKEPWGPITGLSLSPDDKTLAVSVWCDQDPRDVMYKEQNREQPILEDAGRIELWNRQTRQLLKTLKGHCGFVTCVAFSADGKTLISGGSDHSVRFWDPATGKSLKVLDGWHQLPVIALAVSRDSKFAASSDSSGKVVLWETPSGKQVQQLSTTRGAIAALAFLSENRLAVAGSDRMVRIWDIQRGAELQTLWGHEGTVRSILAFPNTPFLATGDDAGIIRIWDHVTGREWFRHRGHSTPVNALASNPNGTILVSGAGKFGSRGNVRAWNTFRVPGVVELDKPKIATSSLSFSCDGNYLAAVATGNLGETDAGYAIWNLADRDRGSTLPRQTIVDNRTVNWKFADSGQPKHTLTGLTWGVSGAFSTTGKQWIVAQSGQATIFDTVSGKSTADLKSAVVDAVWPITTTAEPSGVCAIAKGTDERTLRVIAPSGREIYTFVSERDPVELFSSRTSPDGRWIAVVSRGRRDDPKANGPAIWEGELRIHAAADAKMIVAVPVGANCDYAFSRDGSRLATFATSTAGKSTLGIYRLPTGRIVTLQGIELDQLLGFAGSDNERLLISCWNENRDQRMVRIFDSQSATEIGVIKSESASLSAISPSPDGKRILAIGDTFHPFVKLWDSATFRELMDFPDCVGPAAFSPDGRLIAGCVKSGAIRIWASGTNDISSGRASP